MAGARFMSWHRAGPLAIAVIAAAWTPGCGDDNNNTGGTGGTTTSSTGGTTGGTGGTGGDTGGTTGGTGGTGGGALGTPEATSLGGERPLDSTPDSAGDVVYYTGVSAEGAGVFSLPSGGGTATKVFVGDPFAAPLGITISNDDKTLFVADPGADATPDDPKTLMGAVFSLSTTGAAPTAMTGTVGYKPRGVDIGDDLGEETLFFTGVDKSDGVPGVFKLPVGGGAAKAVVTGAPFVDPSGIAVGKTRIFVADTNADSGTAVSNVGSVIVIENGVAQTFVSNLGVGYPTGIALTADEAYVIVSGLDPETGTDIVYAIDVATKAVTPHNEGQIGKNRDAGGLHRARKTDVFSWADLSSGGTGAVFKVTFK